MEIKIKLKDYKGYDYQVHGDYYKEQGYAYDDADYETLNGSNASNEQKLAALGQCYQITMFGNKEGKRWYIQVFKIEKYTEDEKGYDYPNGCMLIDNNISTFSEDEEKIKITTWGGDNIELVFKEDYGEGL